jgi:Glycosyl transferase family 2
LVAQGAEVAETVIAVGKHDREIAQQRFGIVHAHVAERGCTGARERTGQAQAISELKEQQAARVVSHATDSGLPDDRCSTGRRPPWFMPKGHQRPPSFLDNERCVPPRDVAVRPPTPGRQLPQGCDCSCLGGHLGEIGGLGRPERGSSIDAMAWGRTVTRPLTVALLGSRESSIARLLTGKTTHGRVKLGTVSDGDLRRFLRSLRATRVDLVVIDEAEEWSGLVGKGLRARGIRTAPASAAAISSENGTRLDIAALAAAAARPGAGLKGGPDVSIVTTVLNESRTIDALMTNLTTQMRPSDEFVIVDGGSSDDTWEYLQRWHLRDPRVLVHSAPGCNISAGRNLGIRVARNASIVCTDAGCEPGAGWLDALRAPFAEDPAPGLVGSAARIGRRSARPC